MTYEHLGFLLLREKKFSEAKIFLQNAIKKFPTSTLYRELTEAEFNLGNKDKAQEAALSAWQLNPTDYNRNIYLSTKENRDIKW